MIQRTLFDPRFVCESNTEVWRRVDNLRRRIRYHEHLYYVVGTPEISDREFDELMAELRHLEDIHPALASSDSPARRVGGAATGFSVVEHRTAMLSLENSYSESDLDNWIVRLEKQVGNRVFPLVAELKIDGISATLHYRDGLFLGGATRGDGNKGDDVTANLRTIKSLPLTIATPLDLDVRGEVYVPRSHLCKINRDRVASGEEPFKNCRNLTTGTMKSLDPVVAAQRGLHVMVYGIAQGREAGFTSHASELEFLAKQGFAVNSAWALCQNRAEILAFIDRIGRERDAFDFDIDGIVLKVDRLAVQEELGETTKAPRWAMAFKYAQQRAMTRIRQVVWHVGRSQIITPVAHLDPVELGGTTVARASLHNLDQIREKDIRLGDWVTVEKAGYIIPYVVQAHSEQRTGDEKPIAPPPICPSCGHQTIIFKSGTNLGGGEEKGARQEKARIGESIGIKESIGIGESTVVRCDNPTCSGVLARRIIHFVSGLEIEGIGPQLVAKLMAGGFLSGISDLFHLREADLLDVERMGPKAAAKVIAAIEAGRRAPLTALFTALGIPNVGSVVAETLAGFFPDGLGSLRAANSSQLREIYREDAKGEKRESGKIVESIQAFFADPTHQGWLDETERWWLGPTKEPTESKTTPHRGAGSLKGTSFVLTGESSVPRRRLTQLIKACGGIVQSSVSPKTDYVLVGSLEEPGFLSAKKARALELGIPIIDEFQFGSLVGFERHEL